MKFWMIKKGNTSSDHNPSKVYADRNEAITDMLELAKKKPGERFFLLETVEWAEAVISPVERYKCKKG